MQAAVAGHRCQQMLLAAIERESRSGAVAFLSEDVMQQVVKEAVKDPGAAANKDIHRAVLSYFNDLLRTGVIGLGDTEPIPGNVSFQFGPAPWPNGKAHVTPHGLKTLTQASRDPIYQAGYLEYLDQEAKLSDIAREYVVEALSTYRTCCYKATALLIGAAVETLVLELCDALVHGLHKAHRTVPSGLKKWQVKTAVEAAAKQILPDLSGEAKRAGSEELKRLADEADSRLLPIAAEFRRLRNDAGHPASLGPVNAADVHANLLHFPSTAKLLRRLSDWVTAFYV